MKPINERKLIKILNGLPKKFISDFKDFLGNDARLIKALDALEEKVLWKTKSHMTSEEFYSYLYKKDFHNPDTLNTLFSSLKKELDNYLVLIGFKSDVRSHPRYILMGLNINQARYSNEQIIRDLAKKSSLPDLNSSENYLELHQFMLAQSSFNDQHPETVKEGYWLDLLSSLDSFFRLRTLEVLHGLQTFHIKNGMRLSKELLNRVPVFSKAELVQMPIMYQAYYCSFIMYTPDCSDPDQYFLHLQKIIVENKSAIPNGDLPMLFISLFNYSIHKINQGALKYQAICDEIIDFGLKNSLFLNHDNKVYGLQLKAIVSIKCRLNKLKSAESVFHKFVDKILDDPKGRMKCLIEGLLRFYQERYNDCILTLESMESSDWIMELDLRIIEILARVERNMPDDVNEIYKKRENFRKFLRRNKKIGIRQRESYKKFLLFLMKYEDIIRDVLPTGRKRQKLNLLVSKIIQTDNVSNKQLLLLLINKQIQKMK